MRRIDYVSATQFVYSFSNVVQSHIMPFLGFRADFNPPKQGSKLSRNPQKRYIVIERRLKKRKKKLRRLDCVSATQFLYAFSTVVQCHIIPFGGFRADLDPCFGGLKSARNPQKGIILNEKNIVQ